MNKRNFYFRQPLKENELDGAFGDAETAMFNIVKDLGLYGLASGGKVTPTGVGTCDVAVFGGYDKQGRRLLISAPLSGFDFTNDTAGNPTVPSSAHFRWISLVARHGYAESDGRTDGNGDPVNFVLTEVISATGDDLNTGLLQIISGAEAASSGAAARPSVGSDDVVIADLILNDTGAVDGGAAGVSYSRVTRIPSLVILPHSALASYSAGQLVLDSDGEIYQAVTEVAPGTATSDQTAWKVFNGSPPRAAYTTSVRRFRNSRRSSVAGFDHFAFPSGHFVTLDESWLDIGATTKTATGTGGWFGKWNYRINNALGVAGAIYANGPTNAPVTLPWGPVLGINAFGSSVDAVTVVELVKPLIYMQEASFVMETAFSLFDGGGSGTPLSNSTWALGLSEGTVISGASVLPIEIGAAEFRGTYICRDPSDDPDHWKVVSHGSSGGAGTVTSVTVATNEPHFYKVAILGTAGSDDGTARVLHFIDGVLVANHAVSLVNLFLAPFVRATANQGEPIIFEVGRLRAHARLALNDEFGP